MVADRGQGVQVGNKVIRLVFFLKVNVLLNGAKIVAPVKATCRLYSRKDTHAVYREESQRGECKLSDCQWNQMGHPLA